MEINYKKKNDVLFTANKGYIDIMLASIYSLLTNGNLSNIRLHIICDGFTDEEFKRIEKVIKNFGNAEVYFYPMEDYNLSKYNIPDWHGTQIANARLFFGDILKPHKMNIENLLYLDADTITVGDLNGLCKYADSLHAVRDAGLKHYNKSLDNLDTYYNSGVIYFNVDEWMSKDYQRKIVDLLKENRIKLTYPDQDIFNCAIRNGISDLPVNYNIPPHAYMFDGILAKMYFNSKLRNVGYEEIGEARLAPKIIHTYGLTGIKPWQTDFNPFYDEYMKYITAINHDFIPTDLEGLKKVVVQFPNFYKALLIARTYMTETIEKPVRALALKCHQSNKKY